MPKSVIAILVGGLVAFTIAFAIDFTLAASGAEPASSSWVMAGVIGAAIAGVVMNTAGNRKVVFADAAARQAALSLTPPAGSAMAVVFREGVMGKAIGTDIHLDGVLFTQLRSNQFTAMTLPPGPHTLKAVLAGPVNAGSKPAETAFDLAAGQLAAFRLTLAMKLTTSDVVMTRIEEPATIKPKLARMKMAVEVR